MRNMASPCQRLSKSFVSLARLQNVFRQGIPATRNIHISRQEMSNVLYTAVCVERCPIITASKSKQEQEFSDLLATMEKEYSKLSDHEIQLIKEDIILKSKKETEDDDDSKGEAETETALDREDKWESELKMFSPAPRTTIADGSKDMQSTDRCLEDSLYLLVRQTINGKDHWVLPQTEWQQGETLKQTAGRALTSTCGNVQATFLGPAPCAVAQFGLPPPDEDHCAKVFFYKAWYRNGKVTPNTDKATDYRWVTKNEISEYCNRQYRKHLKKFIL